MPKLTQSLRGYQAQTVQSSLEFVQASFRDFQENPRKLFSAPMGTGKGTIQLAVRDGVVAEGLSCAIVTPSLEVIRGFLSRLGVSFTSEAGAIEAAEAENIWTPVRLRNRVIDGSRAMPDVLIYDEAHHATDSGTVAGTLFTMAGIRPAIGFTATPYRGTPKGTIELRETWGPAEVVLSWEEAVRGGYCAMPRFGVCPLLDDDLVEVRNGEFVATAIESEASNRFDDLMRLALSYRAEGGKFDKATMLALPSRELVGKACEYTGVMGVVDSTSFTDRGRAFGACRDRDVLLVQIGVVGEGVDLPWLKRIIDAKPTMSPVKWFQMVGRVTRPGGEPPEVVVTNRNLERHAYLFEGMLPPATVGEAQKLFDGESERALAARHVGLESIGKFKPLRVKARDYVTRCYMLAQTDEKGALVEWAVIARPTSAPIVARKESPRDGETRRWGKWVKAEMPDDFSGFQTSSRRGKLSEKQANWWSVAAHRYGLDPEIPAQSREFAVLPVLKDLGERL